MTSFYNGGTSQEIFNLIGQAAALEDIIDAITAWLGDKIPDALVSVMLYSEQEQTLNLIKEPAYFSREYVEALKDLKIGPNVGACGAAAYHRRLVVCEDLLNDPNWVAYKDLVKQNGLRACWSVPIANGSGKLFGSFGTYYRSIKSPTPNEIDLLQYAASLIALTFELYEERKKRNQLKDKYQSFFSFHPDAIFEHNLDGNIVDANLATKFFNEVGVKSHIGTKIDHFIEPEHRPLALEAFEQAKHGLTGHLEVQAHNSAGQKYWLDLTFLPIKVNEEIVGIFSVARDITERYQNNEMLRLMKRSVDANPHGIILTSAENDQPIEYFNPAFEQITGYSLEELKGKNCRILQGPDTSTESVQQISEAIQNKSEIKIILKNYRKDGHWFWNKLNLGPVFDENHKCTHFIAIQQDVSQHVAQQELIAYQESHDHLTGFINNKLFEEVVQEKLHLAQSGSANLVLLYLDLDDFEPLNQSLGHDIGDKILKLVGNRLSQNLEPEDVISRFSGDEFAILLTQMTDLKQVAVRAEEIIAGLSQPFHVDGYDIHLSASIGVADADPDIKCVKQFINAAKDAMRDANAEGGNTWHWYNFTKEPLPKVDYVQLRHELMVALHEQQFKLFYQPILDSETGKVKCLEALIRWQHPEKGFISPADFIPFAERTGQIVSIGEWVLRQACEEVKAWNMQHETQISVAVNLSPLQFKRSGFLSDLQQLLAEIEFPHELLKLEVTESMLIASGDKSIEILKNVRALGIKVSVDDFGTGYSSLSYLRSLPIDEIKLDRSFVQHLPGNPRDEAIIEAMITLAHKLDLEVVAEGIENPEQAECLKSHHCDYLQGFYYAKPARLNQLELISS